ncbi:MAG: restriction system protein [Verrucomicrobiota bacterium]|jgi:hypothetical protein
MPNPQLDQFTSALFWKVVPWLILGGGVAILVGTFLKWLERRAISFGQERRKKRDPQRCTPPVETELQESEAPHCPICNAPMVKRTAKRGAREGSEFWGCRNYPECRGTRDT